MYGNSKRLFSQKISSFAMWFSFLYFYALYVFFFWMGGRKYIDSYRDSIGRYHGEFPIKP